MLRCQRLEDDMVVLLVNDSTRSLVDFEIFSEPTGNHHLPFYSEHHGVSLGCWIHNSEYYISIGSKSIRCLLEIEWACKLPKQSVLYIDGRRSRQSSRFYPGARRGGDGRMLESLRATTGSWNDSRSTASREDE